MPSELIVEVCKVDKVSEHPNADRLDLVTIKGWQCCTSKGQYQVGDKVVYFPIDSILPATVEEVLFPPGSKVTLSKSRIKTIKLRGAISQGMVAPVSIFGLQGAKIGMNVKEILGVTKYLPPVKEQPASMKGNQVSKRYSNPLFHKYTGINNIKHYPEAFEGNRVVITEKIHGTNFRAGWLPYDANTLWKKLLQFVGLSPRWEFVYGSHNVQLQSGNKGYYPTNVYWEAVEKYSLQEAIQKGDIWYGEVYGDGIQKGYNYGCKAGERKLVIFDVLRDGEYLKMAEVAKCVGSSCDLVPVLFIGDCNQGHIESATGGASSLHPSQKIREGCVVRLMEECQTYFGRSILKSINPEYLLKDNTEWS